MLQWDDKDPDEHVDFELDWRKRRLDEGDNVAASTWTVPDGLTMTESSFDVDGTVIWLSGGTLNETYVLVNRVETAGGRTMDQSVRLRITAK